jgi:hypothetical protein
MMRCVASKTTIDISSRIRLATNLVEASRNVRMYGWFQYSPKKGLLLYNGSFEYFDFFHSYPPFQYNMYFY